MNDKKSDNKKDSEDKIDNIPVCRECGVILTDKTWYPSFKKKHCYICKECNNKNSKEWQRNNRDKHNQQNRKEYRQLINEVIDAYGGKCKCCGETRREYLTIDHVNGDGRKHNREMGFSSPNGLYRWLRQNNYPEGFQVLCFNCNCGKGNYTVCPRDKEVFEKEFEAKHKTNAKYKWALRLNVIKGYGGKCELCGEDNPHSLTIDHINGDGAEERRVLGGWEKLYKKLRDENYPKDNYRLLCYNCNCALGCGRITEEEIIKDILERKKQLNRNN